MTGNEKIFVDMDTTVTAKVCVGKGKNATAKGKGIIAVDSKKRVKHIQDVLLVPDLS